MYKGVSGSALGLIFDGKRPKSAFTSQSSGERELVLTIDLVVFAIIAAFLVYRLRSVLGTRHGDERQRPNPFQPEEMPKRAEVAAVPLVRAPAQGRPINWDGISSLIEDRKEASSDGQMSSPVREGLSEIAAADGAFDVQDFVYGAKSAFVAIVTAFARGDRGALKPLLSEALFNDFSAGIGAREKAGHSATIDIRKIGAARIVQARLAGVMAYVTVDFDVEEVSVTRDAAGAVVEGDPDKVRDVTDTWTFARDIRAVDPNWILIETGSGEK